jgi:hypothetical protein
MRTYAEGALHRLEIASKAAKHSCEGVVVEMGHEHHKGKRGKESRWKSILMRGGPHTARPPRKVQPVCSKAGGRPACMRPNAGEDWEKLEQVGEGTFGVVYKARHRETGRIVAIKKIKLGRSQEGVQISAIDEIRVLQVTIACPSHHQKKKRCMHHPNAQTKPAAILGWQQTCGTPISLKLRS